jgi:hypothetical protein
MTSAQKGQSFVFLALLMSISIILYFGNFSPFGVVVLELLVSGGSGFGLQCSFLAFQKACFQY